MSAEPRGFASASPHLQSPAPIQPRRFPDATTSDAPSSPSIPRRPSDGLRFDAGGFSRRQIPSPLIFSPEVVAQPSPGATAHLDAGMSMDNGFSSMPFIRKHVSRRLKLAKADCDRQLQRVSSSIQTYFEQKLKESEVEREVEREQRAYERESERERGRLHGETPSYSPDLWSEPDLFQSGGDLKSMLQSDDNCSEGVPDYEPERTGRHSRQPSRHSASTESSSPAPSRRQAFPIPSATEGNSRRQSTIVGSPPVTSLNAHTSLAARRLSRTIHIPMRPPPSGQTSRSTSRSRSPLPPSSHTGSFSEAFTDRSYSERGTNSPSSNKRSSRILVDDPVDPIMTVLYDLIGVATDVLEMSVAQLTAKPKACEDIVQRVQAIGKAWDDHPDWHGRNWYVQVLLAIASLSRVVEWWQAEHSFWNFDQEGGEEDEPLQFVTKILDEDDTATTPSEVATVGLEETIDATEANALRLLSPEEESRLRLSRPPSQGKRRDELKDVSQAMQDKQDEISRMSKDVATAESARVLATERLRLQAETAQNRNIVIELALDGEHFLWVNYAWQYIVGTEPEELPGSRISRFLHPNHWNVFKEATLLLQEDDSHTIEVRFQLRIDPDDTILSPRFQLMEGKGMLMIDREDGHPSHTMWVIKSAVVNEVPEVQLPSTECANDNAEEHADTALTPDGSSASRDPLDRPTSMPFSQPINTTLILCRICECNIPQWYFENHNETCVETHKLEAEIMDCNESIGELRSTIRELIALIERSSPASMPEYRGMPILSPSTSPNNPSPLSLFRGPLSSKVQKMGVKKMQRRLLEQLDDLLTVAAEIDIPALRDDESKEPIERQMLMSPSSERKMTQVRGWFKPTTEDGALTQLLDDSERVMRQKTDNVIRMRNTIKYSEKVRREWEERVLKTLSQYDEDEERDEDVDDDDAPHDECAPAEEAEEQQPASSTTSEYAFNGDEPTASTSSLATVAPTPIPTTESPRSSPDQSPLVAPRPHAPAHQRTTGNPLHNTRSSTPASVISSPLALVPPIVASPSPPPPMSLNDGLEEPEEPRLDQSTATLRSRRSTPNFQPKLLLTPPMSPVPSPKNDATVVPKKLHRRQSTSANAVLSPPLSSVPLSPRLPTSGPVSRSTPTSIKDFDIIKPISKGAFGSVFLARKKATGDYYAIKVLKKADMIAKNQVTNVKAERMILMTQSESPFVAKLYFTFQSKENLYLVMEYLNGGDCATLIQTLGTLPEEWTKNYIAEVVLGLESLHRRGIVHRDLKPDNLLIDQHGHLKLTDFGLSRIGLLDRQTGISGPTGRGPARLSPHSRPPSLDLAHMHMTSPADLLASGSYFGQHRPQTIQRSGSSPYLLGSEPVVAEASAGDGSGASTKVGGKTHDSPMQSFATELTNDLRSHAGGTPPTERKFVGTPDYLAPETILGLRADDAGVDWWALGAVAYEFLYGIPPFHDETPEKVFENILAGHVEYHEEMEYSSEAIDFMQRLLCSDPARRLGANGAEEVKDHPWFEGIDWDKVTSTEAAFIPQVTDPESTEYFNARGAMPFMEVEEQIALRPADSPGFSPDLAAQPQVHTLGTSELLPALGDDNFGSFSFKNLPVLKQANDEVIKKLRTDQMVPLTHTLSEPAVASQHTRRRSISNRIKKPPSVVTSFDPKTLPTNPPSPATSTSSIASSPSRVSMPPSTPASAHSRKGSEIGPVERFRDSDGMRRASSGPSRLRTASVSTSHSGDGSGSDVASGSAQSHFEVHTPPSSVVSLDFKPELRPEQRKLELSDLRKAEPAGDARKPDPVDLRKKPDPHDRAVTILLAEDNPITAKIIETLLIRLGCRCVVVADGSEAISVAMGDIHFDVILMDLHMPVLDGEGAARYIKSTNSKNTHTPIVAVSAYSGTDPIEGSSLFTAAIAKPVQKADILAVMRQLGFKTSSAPTPGGRGSPAATKVLAVAA